MRKTKTFFLLVVFALITITSAPVEARASVTTGNPQAVTDAYSLIAEVNALRAANGQPPYTADPILMGIAQQHAEFMAANGVSHTGYGGTRPYQRALNAGYPLAGDLSLGGFISENITAGNNKSVQDAVRQWQGDAPHLNTMLSPNLTEIGAGVAIVNGYVYYVIDAAQPTANRQPQGVSTLAPGQSAPTLVVYAPPLASTAIPNTPMPDGTIYHIVQPGETLWLIAITYNMKVADIRQLNGMSETEAIYPNEKLLLVKGTGVIPTLAPATPTATIFFTPSPSATLQSLLPTLTLPPTPTATPEVLLIIRREDGPLVLGAILLAALVLALILARGGRG
ncbi:MAG TPA: hypothetical protein DCG54_01895 [Anaerolineae bacterium]|jgi:uncharacterized protein YkwD|nr:hypothetical protein [Anaerolineae bacterium]